MSDATEGRVVMQQVGKYQLIRKLATGGMAEVFLAKAAGPMGFEKTLVLKRILPHLAEEPTFVQMFLSEAKLAARLTHPHIVQIFDFGEAHGAYFLAMEYIDGPSLRALVKRALAQGPFLPPAVCARIISHACEGLAFAHDFTDPETGEPQGLIHRDISPDNILLSRQGAVKVVDFGIAKAAGQAHKTESGVIKGKLAYMPPEQLRARVLDRRVDVYALGAVLFELLTTRRPFESSTDAGLMQAILFESPNRLADLRPDLPESLRRILDRALAREREERYPDCHSFQADLEEFIQSAGKPVTAQQVAQVIAPATVSGTENPIPAPPPEGAPQTPRSPARPAAPQTTTWLDASQVRSTLAAETSSQVATKVDVPSPRLASSKAPITQTTQVAALQPPSGALAPPRMRPRRPSSDTETPSVVVSAELLVPSPAVTPSSSLELPPSPVLSMKETPGEAGAEAPRVPPRPAAIPLALKAESLKVPPTQVAKLEKSRGKSMWGLGLLAGALLLAGGGFVFLRTPSPSQGESVRQGQTPSSPAISPLPSPTPVEPVPDAGVQMAVAERVPGSVEPNSQVPRDPPAESAAQPPEGLPSHPGALPQDPSTREPPRHREVVSRPKPVSVPKPMATGILDVRVRPSATISINGKVVGEAPLDHPLTLPEGKYQVRLQNEELGKDFQSEIEVKAGETFILKKNLLRE